MTIEQQLKHKYARWLWVRNRELRLERLRHLIEKEIDQLKERVKA